MAQKWVCDRCGVDTKDNSPSVMIEYKSRRLVPYDLCVGCTYLLTDQFLKGKAVNAFL